MKVSVRSATPLLAVLLWVAALVVDGGPLGPGSAFLVGLGLLSLATVGVVGMIVSGGRWARRTALTALAGTLTLALTRPVDPIWVISLVATAASGVALFSAPVISAIRKLPGASGPPQRAVLVPLTLLGIPFLLGLSAGGSSTPATLIVGIGAPFAALWYSRVVPGGLYAVRLLWPALAVALAFAQSLIPGVISAMSGVLIAAMAWHPSVKVAFHPPRETGTSYPIAPELAPREILDAANLDDRGRPRK